MEQLELPFCMTPEAQAQRIFDKAKSMGARFSHDPVWWITLHIRNNTKVYLIIDSRGDNSYFTTASYREGSIKM